MKMKSISEFSGFCNGFDCDFAAREIGVGIPALGNPFVYVAQHNLPEFLEKMAVSVNIA